MTGVLYEIGQGGLQRVDTTQFNDLKRGQVLRWGGNMGCPEYSAVITEKIAGFEGRIHYKVIKLKRSYETEQEYKPEFHNVESFSIKSTDDKSVWHSQHHFITNQTIPETEIRQLEEQATKIKQDREQEQEQERIKAEENRKRFNPNNRLIIVSLCFNNSDGMTDYYEPCSSITQWVLKEIPQGKMLLSILKTELQKYPSLKKLNWAEHRETHSFNRFGYSLTSETIKIKDYYPQKEIKGYDGHKRENGFLMVKFGYVGYDGQGDFWNEKPEQAQPSQEIKTNSQDITFKHNTEKGGFEIHFKEKPSQAVLETLKANGYRWGKFNKCWYKKFTAGIEQETRKILNI